MDHFEELVISHAAHCGCGIKKELGNVYYYAYMIVTVDQVPFCRYVEISKEDYDKCAYKYSEGGELDKITAQIFYGEYIYGKQIIYEGIYNRKLLDHTMAELKEYFGELPQEEHLNVPLTAWEKLCKKDLKSLITGTIFASVGLIILVILKFIIKDFMLLDMLVLIALLLVVGFITMLFGMFIEKKKFLNNENVLLYANMILHFTIRHTPTEVITKQFIFNRWNPSRPIDLSKVVWIYRKRVYSNKSNTDQIVMGMSDGKKKTIRYRNSFSENDLYQLVKQYRPEVLMGWSLNNKKEYKKLCTTCK